MRNLYYLLKMARLSLPHKFRKYITILLFLILGFFLFNSAFAVYDPNAKHSKWFHDSIVNDPTVKSTVEVKAQRTYPVSTLGADGKPIIQNRPQSSTIKVAASVSNVGKGLVRRVPSVAITYAVTALLGKAVDWVMDAENNRIKYTDTDTSPDAPSNAQYYKAFMAGRESFGSTAYLAALAACKVYNGSTGVTLYGTSYECSDSGNGVVRLVDNPNYDPSAPASQDKYIPIDTVAAQVISDANDGYQPAMEVMNNTALDMLEQGLLDAQLEAAAEPKQFASGESDPTDPNQTPTDPTDPTDTTDPTSPTPNPDAKPFELPPFCSWATKVCSFIDWMQAEPQDPDDDGDIQVEIPDPDMHVGILERLYIDMPAACPADPILEFMGAKIPFPMSIFCQFAEMMKPLILLFAYIKGLSIIGNGLT